ncbi:MAG TPA: hypothetical protein VJR71_10140 [Pseudolabrys sp.]|nr:hypothetical protein [Pseudolabrys sp.]
MFAQEIREGFVGKLLERFHAVGGKHLQFVPGLLVKLDALSYHRSTIT